MTYPTTRMAPADQPVVISSRQVSGCNVPSLHAPPLTRPSAFTKATADKSATLSPPRGERAGRGVPIRFRVPRHAKKPKEAPHQPEGDRSLGRSGVASIEASNSANSNSVLGPAARRGRRALRQVSGRFMVPMRAKNGVEAAHQAARFRAEEERQLARSNDGGIMRRIIKRTVTVAAILITSTASCLHAQWGQLNGGLGPNCADKVLAVLVLGGELYAGGTFTSPASYVARWDGANWQATGNGPG